MRPALRTDRLRLEPLTSEHTEHVVALNGDAEVLRFIIGRAMSRAEVMDEMAVLLSHEGDLGFWAGFEGEEFAGVWCLTPDADDASAGELGYRLRRAAWGRGLAVEGSYAVVEHGFTTAGRERIWAETMAVNTGSRRVMEKVGLRLVRTYVGEWEEPLPGWERGEVVHELTREEWESGRRLTSSRRGPWPA